MAGYNAWNLAITDYFTAGAAKGTPIFLSLDKDAIDEVAHRFLDEPVDGEPLDDFKKAVHRRVIEIGTSIYINIQGLERETNGVPGGVAFLGLMVLAANNMQEDRGIDESNYFLRLREALNFPMESGRPDGLPPGASEPLWLSWNIFLIKRGFEPTAGRGTASYKYLRYVLSQTILRESDKQYLQQRFHQAQIPRTYDCDQLGFWLSRQTITRKLLREGLHHSDPGRVWEFYQAAHRVYETGDWVTGDLERSRQFRARHRNLECGLYRTEDLRGDTQYWLFAKQPARIRCRQLTVAGVVEDDRHPLRPLRAGFFSPIIPTVPFVDSAVQYDVEGDPLIQKLLFPARNFWILVRDPENPQGTWATWKPYLELGERLLILCRGEALNIEMNRYQEEGLLSWSERIERGDWVEYYNCMVVSYDWGGFISNEGCQALAGALSPRVIASVSLSGGLRDPNQNAWLEGYLPTMKVYGFERRFKLVITSAHDALVFQEEVSRQEEITIQNHLPTGSYKIKLSWNGEMVANRMFRIVSWDSIQEYPEPEEITNSNPVSTAGLTLRGAMIV